MAANMWKSSLKNVESDDDKILYETLLDFVLQRNFVNKPRILRGDALFSAVVRDTFLLSTNEPIKYVRLKMSRTHFSTN